MPAFIKTPADEARWAKAKAAANKTLSESAGDSYWALTNSIYQKMTKSDEESVDNLISMLQKARKRLSDEQPDEDEDPVAPEEAGMREFDPDSEEDDADKWLQENDPKRSGETSDEPEESGKGSMDESSMPVAEDDAPEKVATGTAAETSQGDPAQNQASPEASSPEEVKGEGRFAQPTREEIAEMRQYTRPWEQRARDKNRLEAEAGKNPVLHHEGKLVEARNSAHKAHQDAFAALQASPEYKDADPISQMEMETKFESDFHKQNPEYLANAAKIHGEAHKKGLGAKDVHASAKDEAIRHVLGGGAQPETPMSTEEGLQHAGGTKGEEGTVGSIAQDPSASFASGNRAFLEQYAKDYANKAKKPKDIGDMENYDEGSKKDVQRILGEHPALKDPSKKAKVDAFFQKYHPLIGMSAKKVMNKLGLDKQRGDIDLGVMHEAGMHGLMQAINDYNHDHPSKAAFATHASNKIRGLQQTALRSQDQVPQELRTGAKKFNVKSMIAKHPPEVGDRMKRVNTFKAISKPPKVPTGENNG